MNQNRKRIFNIKLYIDGIKQLKMIGIMSFIIMSLAAFLIPLGININNATAIEQNGVTSLSTIYNLLALNPFLFAVFLIITPLMALYLFGFLNKRNSSDFYHSIPDTRECVFVSYVASVMTWITGIILGTTAISFICSLFMKYVDLNNLSIIVVMFTVFASSVLILGVFLIAMSISGTVFSNISVALMILFVPRLFMTVFTFSLSSLLPFIPFQFSDSIINNRYNVVVDIFTSFFIGGGAGPTGIQLAGSGVYTLVLGLILCGLGMFAYKKRNSEAATYAAVNARLQSIFRLIPAFVICLIPCTVVVEYIYGNTFLDSTTCFSIVVCYVIAILAYFLYELITTKKWKNLLKAIPGLSALLILNVLYVGALYATSQVLISDVPSKDSIDSIRIIDNSSQDYFKTNTESVKFTSDSMKQLVSDQLKNTVESWTNSEKRGQYYRNSRTTVAIQTGNRTIYRTVSFEDKANKQFSDEIWATKAYTEALYTLPELGKNQTNVKLYTGDGVSYDASDLYKSYCDEVKKLSIGEYYSLVSENGGYGSQIGYMNVDTTVGTKNYIISLPITTALPNTLKNYVELTNKGKNSNPVKDYFNAIENIPPTDAGSRYINLQFELYDTDGAQYSGSANYNSSDNNGANIDYTVKGETLLKEIESKLDTVNNVYAADKKLVKITYNSDTYGSNNKYDSEYYSKIYYIDNELYDMFLQYTGNTKVNSY